MLNLYPFDDSGDVILKRILCCVILFGLLKLCFNFAFFDRYIAIGDGYILSPNFFDGTRISLQNSSGDTLIDGMVGYYTHASDTLHGEIGDYLGHPYQYFYVDASMSEPKLFDRAEYDELVGLLDSKGIKIVTYRDGEHFQMGLFDE